MSSPVFFPQTCSHLVNSYNSRGELRTALITGSNRLVILKQGRVSAESTLVDVSRTPFTELKVHKICMCPFSDNIIRIVVASNSCLNLFELDDTEWSVGYETQLRSGVSSNETKTFSGSYTEKSVHDNEFSSQTVETSETLASDTKPMEGPKKIRSRKIDFNRSGSTYLSPINAGGNGEEIAENEHLDGSPCATRLRLNTCNRVVVDMAFVTERTLCVAYDDEAVVIKLQAGFSSNCKKATKKGSEFLDEKNSHLTQRDYIIWRSMGSYTAISVCRINRHVAFALRSSTIAVFPLKATSLKNRSAVPNMSKTSEMGIQNTSFQFPEDDEDETNSKAITPVVVTPVFSPTCRLGAALFPTKVAKKSETDYYNDGSCGSYLNDASELIEEPDVLADKGLTSSLSDYDIIDLKWHRLAACSLLCVFCSHKKNEYSLFVVLYAVRSVPHICHNNSNPGRYKYLSPKDRKTHDFCRSSLGGTIQLTVVGTISFPSQVINRKMTGIVSNFSRSRAPSSFGSKIEFLHMDLVNGDVQMTSYRFGQNRCIGFGRCPSKTRQCKELLKPLINSYGVVEKIEILPAWKSRKMGLGKLSPQSEAMYKLRRYRLVVQFGRDGLIAVVMIDLDSAVAKIETFLTLGKSKIISILSFDPKLLHSSQKLIAALCTREEEASGTDSKAAHKNQRTDLSKTHVVVFSQRLTIHGCEITLLSVSPVSFSSSTNEERIQQKKQEQQQLQEAFQMQLPTNGMTETNTANAKNSLAEPKSAVPCLDDILSFVKDKCPEKEKMVPTLLQACGGDAAKLLDRLKSKYGCDVSVASIAPSANPTPQSKSQTNAFGSSNVLALKLLEAAITDQGLSLLGTCVNGESGSDVQTRRPHRLRFTIPPSTVDCLAPVRSILFFGGFSIPASTSAILTFEDERNDARKKAQPPYTSRFSFEVERSSPMDGRKSDSLGIRIVGPLVPPSCEVLWLPSSLQVESDILHVKEVLIAKGQLLLNNDVVVGVMVKVASKATETMRPPPSTQFAMGPVDDEFSVLLLYGLTAIQQVQGAIQFKLEAVLQGVSDFFLGEMGEVISLLNGENLRRCLRCFPFPDNDIAEAEKRDVLPPYASGDAIEQHNNFHYVWDHTWSCPLNGELAYSTKNANDDGNDLKNRRCCVHSIEQVTWSYPWFSEGKTSSQLLFSTSRGDFLHIRPIEKPHQGPKMVRGGLERVLQEDFAARLPVAQYHPDAIMQNIGMGRWPIVKEVLQRVSAAAAEKISADVSTAAQSIYKDEVFIDPAFLAHLLCSTSAGTRFTETLRECSIKVFPIPVGLDSPEVMPLAPTSGRTAPLVSTGPARSVSGAYHDSSASPQASSGSRSMVTRFSEIFSSTELLQNLSRLLPHVILSGVNSQEQLDLFCIVDALQGAAEISHSVDEAAVRFFFVFRLGALRRRLKLTEGTGAIHSVSKNIRGDHIDVSSIVEFAQGPTAARSVETVSYLWAAMSDSQQQIIQVLFGKADAVASGGVATVLGKPLTWRDLEIAGVSLWVKSMDILRSLAERLARASYQESHDITSCALMYILARKLGTLAALCKSQNNTKLHAFFSRNFQEESHRKAASMNAYAALSKNMIQYAAAFFILAGEPESAAQAILQRGGNALLALFVLRLSSDDSLPLLKCFTSQWERECANCGGMDVWTSSCLKWLCGEYVEALQGVAAHPTAHPEVLSVLRYAKYNVSALARRGDAFLPQQQELIILMRLSRFCFARNLHLSGTLCYREVEGLLIEIEEKSREAERSAIGHGKPQKNSSSAQTETSRMTADFSTGTLAFKGFGDDSDDEQPAPTIVQNAKPDVHLPTSSETEKDPGAFSSTSYSNPKHVSVSESVVCAIRLEAQFALQVMFQMRRYSLSLHDAWPVSDGVDPSLQEGVSPLSEGEEDHKRSSMISCTGNVLDDAIFYAATKLFFAVYRKAPLWLIEQLLAELLRSLNHSPRMFKWDPTVPAASPKQDLQDSKRHAETSGRAKIQEATPPSRSLFVLLARLCLGKIATWTRNSVVANILLKIPWSVLDLTRNAKPVCTAPKTSVAHPLTAFFVALIHFLREEMGTDYLSDSHRNLSSSRKDLGTDVLSFEGPTALESTQIFDNATLLMPLNQHKSIWDSESKGSHCAASKKVDGDGKALRISELDSKTLLFRWFCVAQYHKAIKELRHYAERELHSEEEAFTSHETCDPFRDKHFVPYRLLHCCLLNYCTLRFCSSSEECADCINRASEASDATRLTNPNGIFLEMESDLTLVSDVLTAALAATAGELEVDDFAGGGKRSIFLFQGDLDREGNDPDTTKMKKSTGIEAHNQSIVTPGILPVVPIAPTFLPEPILWNTKQPYTSHEDVSLLLVELCLSFTEFFWQAPSAVSPNGVVNFDSLVAGLEVNITKPGDLQQLLYSLKECYPHTCNVSSTNMNMKSSTSKSDSPSPNLYCKAPFSEGKEVLQFIDFISLRRHHTYRSLRDALLYMSFPGRISEPITSAQRLILSQCTHSICSVNFDKTSLDSLVWSTTARTEVSHGHREILSGDSEQRVHGQRYPHGLFSTAFTDENTSKAKYKNYEYHLPSPSSRSTSDLSLPSAGSTNTLNLRIPEGKVSENSFSSTRATAASASLRPQAGLAAASRPATHPYLPFYLCRHTDGHIDLYSFGSSECMGTFLCPHKSPVVTDIHYSDNGHLFVAGLQNGSVVGWKFNLAPDEKIPPYLHYSLFGTLGVKEVFFCGDRSTIIVVVGVEYLDASSSSSSPAASSSQGIRAPKEGEGPCKVGILLLLDIALNKGDVIVRCELPFIAEFAAFIPDTESILCVSKEGLMAIYHVQRGSLSFIGQETYSSVIHNCQSAQECDISSLEPSLLSTRSLQKESHSCDNVIFTKLAVDLYDPFVALGTSDGFALLLRFDVLIEASHEEAYQVKKNSDGNKESSVKPIKANCGIKKSVLHHATRIQIAPVVHPPNPNCEITDLTFTPSSLVAGLVDGKVIATVLISQSLRQKVSFQPLSNCHWTE